VHAEASVRTAASDAMLAIVRSCPQLRGATLACMAALTVGVPDEATQAIRSCLQQIGGMIKAWKQALQQQQLSGCCVPAAAGNDKAELLPSCLASSTRDMADTAASDAAAAVAALSLDVPRIEGALLVLMCSCDGAVRREALAAVQALSTLHSLLMEAAAIAGLSGVPLVPSWLHLPAVFAAGGAAAGGSVTSPVGAATATATAPRFPGASGVADSAASMAPSSLSVPSGSAASLGSSILVRHRYAASRDSLDLSVTVPTAAPGAHTLCLPAGRSQVKRCICHVYTPYAVAAGCDEPQPLPCLPTCTLYVCFACMHACGDRGLDHAVSILNAVLPPVQEGCLVWSRQRHLVLEGRRAHVV
jgi:hypothetical protein